MLFRMMQNGVCTENIYGDLYYLCDGGFIGKSSCVWDFLIRQMRVLGLYLYDMVVRLSVAACELCKLGRMAGRCLLNKLKEPPVCFFISTIFITFVT